MVVIFFWLERNVFIFNWNSKATTAEKAVFLTPHKLFLILKIYIKQSANYVVTFQI